MHYYHFVCYILESWCWFLILDCVLVLFGFFLFSCVISILGRFQSHFFSVFLVISGNSQLFLYHSKLTSTIYICHLHPLFTSAINWCFPDWFPLIATLKWTMSEKRRRIRVSPFYNLTIHRKESEDWKRVNLNCLPSTHFVSVQTTPMFKPPLSVLLVKVVVLSCSWLFLDVYINKKITLKHAHDMIITYSQMV